MAFSWFFRGFFVALFYLEKQCSGLFRYFFVVFSWFFRGFFVAPVLGKFYAYSPWNSLLIDGPAIRNANRGDSRESIRRKPHFHHVPAIRANRLKTAIRNF